MHWLGRARLITYDGVLEATGVLEVQVKLAVLGAVGHQGSGSDVCLELVETEGDELFAERLD